ncbi:transcriptional regulator, LacI family protein [Pseudooceanicola batsensis HTCC2597]|uniref:Transcriptional regulator, LacI family protein n=1 Tax=Pseudooceanicola batsensis (strain ATCC BAA-863 / DSM 15984 / KCTC 12145 / HTCC2597) TaxID=252305 RepID=A3TUQ0_PSEBH|nr:LacI family DNA-binding transcriptional regulator [Pseudooceanicola batsensis]EAQ04246.1 transcriptional regulator, LacI family protein [Pseudooceanicola batsensis HTCC2597]
MSARVRIKDVATLAGVSTATVSRALSSPDTVGPATRDKVMEAVKATGYRINAAARDLRQRRARSILILAPNLSNTFFSRIFAAIQEEASAVGLTVQISDSRIGRDRLLSLGYDGRADGIVLLDGSLDPELVNGWHLPLVQLSEWNDAYDAPRLGIDNRAAAGLAVDHLADLGHRALLHVSGPEDNVLALTRREGFLDTAESRDLARIVLPGDFTLEAGAEAARRWSRLRDRPTGVFCASDECALGFISECVHMGFDVPGEVSVMGFDDIDFADRFLPSLTTIHQPRKEMGRAAARRITQMMQGSEGTLRRSLPPATPIAARLVKRSSTAAPPAAPSAG